MMSRRLPLLFTFTSALALAALALTPRPASAQELRFTATAPGGIAGTGNTLGLAKAFNLNGPGTEDSIGTFISLGNGVDNEPMNPGNEWPAGTTNNWMENGSSAVLALPPEVEVLYAELLWGGSHSYDANIKDAVLDTPVTLSAGNASMMVSPDPNTDITFSKPATGFTASYYMRSANVTEFVQLNGAGMYNVAGVPATETTMINSLNAAGWTLVVAYRDQSAPTRNLSVFVGGSFVDENVVQDYTVSGFCAPPAGDVEGTVIVSAIEGDADLPGDQLLIAPTAAGQFENLSGPNNPAQNFFCSQLNDSSGNLDTQGSFGAMNHNAAAGMNVAGGRQGWDVTTVPLSSVDQQLENSQTSAVIRTITTGDSFLPTLVAFAIDVNAPEFTGAAASTVEAPPQAALGDKFTFKVTLKNGGEVTAQDIKFTLPLDPGLSLLKYTTDGVVGDAGGGAVDATALEAGVSAGDLPAGQTREVALEVEAVGPPKNNAAYFLKAKWDYGFEVCANQPLVPESFSQSALVNFDDKGSSSSSGSGSASVGSGTMASSSGSGAGGEDGAGGGAGTASGGSSGTGGRDGGEAGGCSCSTPGLGGGGELAAGALGLLGLAALRLRGRRRSVKR